MFVNGFEVYLLMDSSFGRSGVYAFPLETRLPCTYLCSSRAGSVFVYFLVVEELVQLVQRLTSSEESNTASVASLTDAVNRIRAEHEAVVSHSVACA